MNVFNQHYFRSFQYLFELIDSNSAVEYTLKASYLEVYNEKVQKRTNVLTHLTNVNFVVYTQGKGRPPAMWKKNTRIHFEGCGSNIIFTPKILDSV